MWSDDVTQPSGRPSEIARIFDGVADGSVVLRDVLGVLREDIQALERVGGSAIQAGRYATAIKVFSMLEALAPDEMQHAMHLAIAYNLAGRRDEALDAVTRALDVEDPFALGDVARALLLRAELLGSIDREAATADLIAARELAETSDEARAVLDGRMP